MKALNVKLLVLGHLPATITVADLLTWRSALFRIDSDIERLPLTEDAQGSDWEYPDEQLESLVHPTKESDLLLVLLNVKLQQNWYVRRLKHNRIALTFYELDQILRSANIPLKNLVLRALYACTLVYKRYGDRLPATIERINYAHDETRGCLFDMTPDKSDVIHSCHRPSICEQCNISLTEDGIPKEIITAIQSEIRRIKKPLFYRMTDFVKNHPVWSIVISLLTALLIGIVASLIATYGYDRYLRNYNPPHSSTTTSMPINARALFSSSRLLEIRV